MSFSFIEDNHRMLPTERLCQIMDISSRGYRAYKSRPISQRQREDMVFLAHIREQPRLSLNSYGRPRMTEELKELGLSVDPRRVGRLMRQNAISVVTTHSKHTFTIAPNLLNRNCSADQPDQKWGVDISYTWTREGWLYLAVVLDLHSRRVIGWAVRRRIKRDLAIRNDKSNCYDNAAMETFFKTIKAELIRRHSWQTRRAVEIAIFEYINGFYNPRRKHSALDWKSPLAFEAKTD